MRTAIGLLRLPLPYPDRLAGYKGAASRQRRTGKKARRTDKRGKGNHPLPLYPPPVSITLILPIFCASFIPETYTDLVVIRCSVWNYRNCAIFLRSFLIEREMGLYSLLGAHNGSPRRPISGSSCGRLLVEIMRRIAAVNCRQRAICSMLATSVAR